MHSTALLRVITVIELGAGVGLLAMPATVAELLAGQPLSAGVPTLVARVAALALIAIATVCWLETVSGRPGAPTALLIGLLAYNGTVALLLVYSALANGIVGIGLWPTVVLHGAIMAWIAACLRSKAPGSEPLR